MTDAKGTAAEPLLDRPASSGIAGLDDILRGGFVRDDVHLVRGTSGTGKTTLALQFLLAGAQVGESGLYITLSQTRRGLEAIARSHGWSLDGVKVREPRSDATARLTVQQSVLPTSEVELEELIGEIRGFIEERNPRRVVVDSLGVIGLFAGTLARYQQEIVSLRHLLAERACTTLFIGNEPLDGCHDVIAEIHILVTSIIQLEQRAPDYGETRRRLRVLKARSVDFHSGHHNFRIKTGGLEVYPRIRPPEAGGDVQRRFIPSGLDGFDDVVGGGLELGTTSLLIGPPGAGKSTLAAVYARAAAEAGERAAVFLFDEPPEAWLLRAQGVGADLQPAIDRGHAQVELVEAASITPGEFAYRIRTAVEDRQFKVVVIDSVTGYFNVMGNTHLLIVQMHELLTFLSRHGVITILIITQEGFMSVGTKTAIDVSYLSDTIVAMRLFEHHGKIRRCLSAVKKRHGEEETTIRELTIRPGAVTVGMQPLRQFRNLFSAAERVTEVPADEAADEDGDRP